MKPFARGAALAVALAFACAPALAQPGPTHDPAQSRAGYDYSRDTLRTDCLSGCASATPFTPTGAATRSVSTSSARVALPNADATLVVENTGATDAYFKLGDVTATAATTDYRLSAGHSIVVGVGANTYLAAITASGSTSLSITQGSGGQPSLAGGGGTGGGGGAVTSTVGAFPDGWSVTHGATTDAACATDNGNCAELQLLKRNNQRLTSAITALGSPFQAGGSIGNTGFGITGSLPDTGPGDLAAIRAAMVAPYGATVTTTVTRPADTTAYAVNDTWADSTSAPTTGGFTLSNACRTSGGAGVAISATVVSTIDPATPLQGEVWVFDSAVTAVNDNAAFALSDGDAVKLVGVIPFTLVTTVAGSGTNSYYHVDSLNMAYTCSGSANLRFLFKVKNAYTPAASEALTLRLAVIGTN